MKDHLSDDDKASKYRGSIKHKNRPGIGRKGTLCPEWTHCTDAGGFNGDPFNHPWDVTVAHSLFEESTSPTSGGPARYATRNGVAFKAVETNDGTWHGYPLPWNNVPAELKDLWLENEKVTKRELRRYKDFPSDNITWALEGDD